jgi:hypothetical protein
MLSAHYLFENFGKDTGGGAVGSWQLAVGGGHWQNLAYI